MERVGRPWARVGLHHRLAAVEAALPGLGEQAEAAAYARAWAAAWDELLATMGAQDRADLQAVEAPAPATGGVWCVWTAAHTRVVARIGWPDAPAREPDRPLALPPAVASIYRRRAEGLHVIEAQECAMCGYLVPHAGRTEPSEPPSDARPYTYRRLVELVGCPLCEGPLQVRRGWQRSGQLAI